MQTRMILDGLTVLAGIPYPRTVRVIGGGSRNRLYLSIKASVLDRPLVVIDEPEATALGAALLGGVAAGLYPNFNAALAELDRPEHTVEPDRAAADHYAALRTGVFEYVHAAVRPLHHRLADLEARRSD